jgi:hypothetical protein
MDSDVYREVFPEVALAADSKAAGRWETNKGGEYFACLRRYVLVQTQRGLIPAGQVAVGDSLLNASGWVCVQEVFDSEHDATVTVAGLDCSLDHPIWTVNRGWVFAGQLEATDFNSLSDMTAKANIATIDNAIGKVRSLRGVTFNWKDNGMSSLGVIAQEIEAILPELVHTNESGEKTVSYNGLIGLLIEAVKYLDEEIRKR